MKNFLLYLSWANANISSRIGYDIWLCCKRKISLLKQLLILILWVSVLMSQMQLLTPTQGMNCTNHVLFVQHKVKRLYSWGTYTTYWMAEAVLVPPPNCVMLLMLFSKVLLSEKEKWILDLLENWTMANCKNRGKISTYKYIHGFCQMQINAILKDE